MDWPGQQITDTQNSQAWPGEALDAPVNAPQAPVASSDSIGGPLGSVLDYFNLQRQAQPQEQQSVGARALEAAGRTINQFVPRSVNAGASLFTPAVQGIEDIYNAPQEIQRAYQNRNLPGQGPIYEAEQTPPWSQERFNVGSDIVAQMLMAKGLAGQIRPADVISTGEPNASAITSPEGVSQPEIRPSVGQGTPLRQQGETAGAQEPIQGAEQGQPNVPEPRPGEQAAAPVIPPEDLQYAGIEPKSQGEFQTGEAEAGQRDTSLAEPSPVGRSGEPGAGPQGGQPAGTSIKNSYTDAAREKYGLTPAVQEARKSLGQSLVEAQSAESREPGTARRLVDDINSGRVKAIDDTGDGLLTIETIDAQVERSAAEDAVNNARTPDELDGAKARLQSAKDRQQAAYDADKLAGTHAGRGLNARQMVARNDYSLTRMEGATRAAQNGRPLDAKQSAYIEGLQNRIETLEKQASQYQAGKVTPRVERMRIKSDALTARKSGKSLGDFLSEKADAARARIKQMEDVGVDCI